MKYTVVHSKDPYMLARLATDLQMSGAKIEDNDFHPFTEFQCPTDYIHTCIDQTFTFQNHDWCPLTKSDDRHELTSRNYIKVLTQILEP